MAKKTATKKPKPKARAMKPTTSTALVLSKSDISRVRAELVDRLAAEGAPSTTALTAPSGVLGEDAIIGMVGQFDIKLTERENAILDEPVNPEDVAIKPTGELYLPHEAYTRWFNRAFGRGQWALVPSARPRTNNKSVVIPYVLYIHGKPAAMAWGEQEYHESNDRQTLGDAVESTVASALRRVAKRLGVGLELWRKSWLEEFVHRNAVPVKAKVWSKGSEKVMTQWRLKNQMPLKGEMGVERAGDVAREAWPDDRPARQAAPQQAAQSSSRPPAGTDGRGGNVISDKQATRFWGLARSAGLQRGAVETWLRDKFSLARVEDMKRDDYDYACEQIEAGRIG